MIHTTSWFIRSGVAFAALLSCSVGSAGSDEIGSEREARGGGGGGSTTPTTYSGRAVVVDATIAGIEVIVSDTGELPASGGAIEKSLLEFDQLGVTGRVAHASTVGQADQSAAKASVADFAITAAGHTIAAEFLMSQAQANCGNGRASSFGSSQLVGLTIDGQMFTASGAPNQRIDLVGGGFIIINEQTVTSSGRKNTDITVNALHVFVPNPIAAQPPLADVIIASSHADINCGSGPCVGGDFITGGGWITSPGRDTFGVAGGIKNNVLWGHLTFIDHLANMKVKGTGVTSYTPGVTGPTSRRITGNALINDMPGSYVVDVDDRGEPGRGVDTFKIQLSTGYTAAGTLTGGNIQLHQRCK
jgi:hypothetical protein